MLTKLNSQCFENDIPITQEEFDIKLYELLHSPIDRSNQIQIEEEITSEEFINAMEAIL